MCQIIAVSLPVHMHTARARYLPSSQTKTCSFLWSPSRRIFLCLFWLSEEIFRCLSKWEIGESDIFQFCSLLLCRVGHLPLLTNKEVYISVWASLNTVFCCVYLELLRRVWWDIRKINIQRQQILSFSFSVAKHTVWARNAPPSQKKRSVPFGWGTSGREFSLGLSRPS